MLKTKVPTGEDLNPQETAEWLQALDEVVEEAGHDRARRSGLPFGTSPAKR